jgi:hypothetical protein
MATYDYITKTGGTNTFEAANEEEALAMLPTLSDRAPTSGAQLVPTQTNLTSPAPLPTTTTSPQLPEPTAPAVQESYYNSLNQQVETSRESLEKMYQTQLDQVTKDKDQTQKEIDALTEQQQALIETDVRPLLEPFREKLENKERERLYIQENFDANQKLTRELDNLLTEGNELIKSRKSMPIALQTLNKTVSKTMADVTARAGVIQAVMSARNNQIGEAYRMIDRSVQAITADRKDQINYYQTLLDFYGSQKDEKGKKLLNLDKSQQQYIQAQISLAERDLQRAEANADRIKEAMTDPRTAQIYADAGVTLNDSEEVIGQKIAQAMDAKELSSAKEEALRMASTQNAPQSVITAISLAKSIDDVIKATGIYGGDVLGRELKQLSIKQANLNLAKTNQDIKKTNLEIQEYENATQVLKDDQWSSIINGTASLLSSARGKQSRIDMANYIANGNFKSAWSEVANAVEEKLTGDNATRFGNQRTDYEAMKGLREAIQEYSDAGGKMGLLVGTAEDISNRLAGVTGDPKLTALATQLNREFQTYRTNATGAAFSPEESREYAKVNPRTTASLDLNLTIIDGALNQLENRILSAVKTRVPGAEMLWQINTGQTTNDYLSNVDSALKNTADPLTNWLNSLMK